MGMLLRSVYAEHAKDGQAFVHGVKQGALVFFRNTQGLLIGAG